MRTVAILTSPNAQEARSHRQPVGRRGHPSLRAHRLAGSLWGCRLISGLGSTGRYLIGSSRRTIPGRGRILISKQETHTPNPRGPWFKVNAMYQIHHRCLTANDSPSASCVSSSTRYRLSIVAFVSCYDITGSPLQVITRSLRRVSPEQIVSSRNDNNSLIVSKQRAVNNIS